ncbi:MULTISPECIES: helix-turn-helix transcriptional regulator [unclassified Streptomyces]|uniref:helix-turn-helix transcriptional regulator n=1 Tax=unclassified Streptomyces TaxID=2593676 RepID=UPI002E295147|nr:AAA family ATPase [Streptomyces sp. NBC_00223]
METFVGRRHELAVLRAALESARAGSAQFVLVEGDPGAGKSTLLAEFTGRTAGTRALWLRGEEDERLLTGAALDTMVRNTGAARRSAPPASGGHPRSPLRDAAELIDLLGALPATATGTGSAPGTGTGTMAATEVTAGSGPGAVVLIVDDLQWLDQHSAEALLLALRRLRNDCLLTLATVRSRSLPVLGEPWLRFLNGDPLVTRLPLGSFSVSDIWKLASVRGTAVTPQVAAAVLRDTGGNPLHCRLVLDALDPAARAGLTADLPTPVSIDQMVRHRLNALSAPARAVAEAAAVLGPRPPLRDVAVVAAVDDPSGAAAELAAGYLLDEQPGTADAEVRFTHPLIRRAVEATIRFERRRELHARAGTLGGPVGLAYRAAAASGPDDRLAAELEQEARNAAAAGAVEPAAELLRRAAGLCGDAREGHRLMLDAFETLLDSGNAGAAEPFGRRFRAEAAPDARTAALLGRLDMLGGRVAEAERLLDHAWHTRDGQDRGPGPRAGPGPAPAPAPGPDRTLSAVATGAAQLANFLVLMGDGDGAGRWIGRAIDIGGAENCATACVLGIVRAMVGDLAAAADAFAHLPQASVRTRPEDTDALTIRGLVRTLGEDFSGAITDLSVAWSRTRSGWPSRLASQTLTFLADAEYRQGHWGDAATHTELSVSLAHDADRVWELPFIHGYAVLVPAACGNTGLAQAHAEAARSSAIAVGIPAGLVTASAACAVAAGARGDHSGVLAAAEQLRAIGDPAPFDSLGLWEWRPAEIEAYLAQKRWTEAERALDEMDRMPSRSATATRATEAARLRAGLALARHNPAAAAIAFERGRAAAPRAGRYTRALLDLEEGRRLAAGERRRAVALLTSAREVFRTLGARPALAAASRELASRDVLVPAAPSRRISITPAQASVARLVTAGRSNREIAAELVVSVKTVEYHLAQIYAANGIRSRTELTALLVAGGWPGAR